MILNWKQTAQISSIVKICIKRAVGLKFVLVLFFFIKITFSYFIFKCFFIHFEGSLVHILFSFDLLNHFRPISLMQNTIECILYCPIAFFNYLTYLPNYILWPNLIAIVCTYLMFIILFANYQDWAQTKLILKSILEEQSILSKQGGILMKNN